jgi:heme oxygenase
MSKLKELTWEHHKDAERQTFVKSMFKGELTDEQYAFYLWQQHACYDVLEAFAMMHGLFNDIPNIRRTPALLEDARELWPADKEVTYVSSVREYHDHLKTIANDPDKIMAHVYVRHMGDLSGGQMLAKRTPGSNKYYHFDCDVTEYKDKIRAKCKDDMADEAIVCFEFATKMFKDLGNEYNLG